ncbi:dimer_Tnp_hAT domain-containing protein [Trichonephila clavipes]|nr:dimer_Tnp_hAT domain-containing protein [Trichonephila clavipes]
MYPDVISFDKLNLSQFDWLEIEELEMQLIDFQSSSVWIQKFIEAREKLELIEAERLTSNISKNTSNEILEVGSEIGRQIWKWGIGKPDVPDQDSRTKLLNYNIVIGP